MITSAPWTSGSTDTQTCTASPPGTLPLHDFVLPDRLQNPAAPSSICFTAAGYDKQPWLKPKKHKETPWGCGAER